MRWRDKPVILMGHGVRASGGTGLAKLVLELGVPVLTSWQAADLVDCDHPNFFGRPGVYGQRCANKVLYQADQVVLLGCRGSVWTIGHQGFRPAQEVVMFDIDLAEKKDGWDFVRMDARQAVEMLARLPPFNNFSWPAQCDEWRAAHPWLDHTHANRDGKLNAYWVVNEIGKHLRDDEIIVTDMGVALCGAFQVLKTKPPQRLLTSGGLGEMGVALPAAIGASFARNKGRVVCLHCDGGMMMNLQELQTIVHHNLPIKIVVFANDGYLMLKSTEKNLGYKYAGVDSKSGVSLPDYQALGNALGIRSFHCAVSTSAHWKAAMGLFLQGEDPQMMVVHTDPEQAFSPKLQPIVENGAIRSPRFDELT